MATHDLDPKCRKIPEDRSALGVVAQRAPTRRMALRQINLLRYGSLCEPQPHVAHADDLISAAIGLSALRPLSLRDRKTAWLVAQQPGKAGLLIWKLSGAVRLPFAVVATLVAWHRLSARVVHLSCHLLHHLVSPAIVQPQGYPIPCPHISMALVSSCIASWLAKYTIHDDFTIFLPSSRCSGGFVVWW